MTKRKAKALPWYLSAQEEPEGAVHCFACKSSKWDLDASHREGREEWVELLLCKKHHNVVALALDAFIRAEKKT